METLANPAEISPKLPPQPLLEPPNPPQAAHSRKPRASRLGLPPPEPSPTAKTLGRQKQPQVSASDFAPEEFLAQVRDAARDASVCRLLDASLLRSWATAFVRETGLVVSSMADLVDVDAPKGPETTDGLSPRRKKKSVAELISVPETTPVVSSRKRKPKEIVSSVHLPSVEVGSGVAEEGIGSPRRERKKSKYLSPPYTIDTKGSNSLKDEEVEETKDVNESSVEGKMGGLRKYAGISADVILSQLLLAASDPLRPKSNRPGRAIWGFFTEFRSFLCEGDSEFENYLKSLGFSGDSNRIIVSREPVNEVEVAKSAENNDLANVGVSGKAGSEPRKKGRKPKNDQSLGENSKKVSSGSVDQVKKTNSAGNNKLVEVGGNVEAGFSLGNEPRKRGRKQKKDQPVGENLKIVNTEFINEAKEAKSVGNNNLVEVEGIGEVGLSLSSEPRKRERKPKKDQFVGENTKRVSSEFVDETEVAKSAGISNPVKVGGNVEAGLGIGNEPRKRGRKLQKDQPIAEKPANFDLRIENDSQGTSGLVTIKNKEAAAIGSSEGKAPANANGGAPQDFVQNTIDFSKSGKSGQKGKSSEEGPNGVVESPTLVGKVTNSSEGHTARQTRKKKEGNVATPSPGPIHPLSYIRENLESMILTLTGLSSGTVSTECLTPEVKENLILEMQGLLNKVNNLQTGTNIATI
ncbi:uncharacterized protein M6B38_202100 [Iris pallida]|uniref:Uncharacterized protein n=1 Tax=Iris pallida TaxID=29817 RepID=A0AAX6EA71_IRIPA|nr:uncharacterized protein M6B38_202100 [Iris pallida]